MSSQIILNTLGTVETSMITCYMYGDTQRLRLNVLVSTAFEMSMLLAAASDVAEGLSAGSLVFLELPAAEVSFSIIDCIVYAKSCEMAQANASARQIRTVSSRRSK
jgi:hypothetical protein